MMIPDSRFRELLRDAREHRRDLDNLIELLERLSGSSSTIESATRSSTSATTRTARRRLVAGDAALELSATKRTELAGLPVRDAVRRVLEKSGPLNARNLIDVMIERGWTTRGKDPRASIHSAVFHMTKSGELRVVDTKRSGHPVYALTNATTQAAKKLAAAIERANATTKTTTNTTKRSTRGPRADVTLSTLIVGELANSDGLSAREVYDRVLASGWKTASTDPMNTIRTELARAVKRGTIVSDDSGERIVFRLVSGPPPVASRRPGRQRATTVDAVPTTTH